MARPVIRAVDDPPLLRAVGRELGADPILDIVRRIIAAHGGARLASWFAAKEQHVEEG
jgi:hypothetical protein